MPMLCVVGGSWHAKSLDHNLYTLRPRLRFKYSGPRLQHYRQLLTSSKVQAVAMQSQDAATLIVARYLKAHHFNEV